MSDETTTEVLRERLRAVMNECPTCDPDEVDGYDEAEIREMLSSHGVECGDVNEVFGPGIGPVCTEPAGHDGDHIATDRTQTRPGYPGGTVVSRWEKKGAGGR